jgi:Glyoxalase/Bleomycin resistance protein/Dioxygenase superfamily
VTDQLDSLLGPPVQIAYIVPDVYRAAAEWVTTYGAGPFFVRPHIEVNDVRYRGRPGVFDHSSAYGQWGSLMVELVQDHGLSDSVGREMYGLDEGGIHHHAHFVDDLDRAVATLVSEGHVVAMSARSTATRFCFVDMLQTLGHFIELYEPSPRLVGFYDMVASAAVNWDGSDPVRVMG